MIPRPGGCLFLLHGGTTDYETVSVFLQLIQSQHDSVIKSQQFTIQGNYLDTPVVFSNREITLLFQCRSVSRQQHSADT